MMVKNRQSAIPELAFAPPVGTPAGMEVMTLSRLRARISRHRLAFPQRPAFHQLITVTSGVLGHTVDFTPHDLTPEEWLWIRPGQVQQWRDLEHAEGRLILFQSDFPDRATAVAARLDDPHAPVALSPPMADGQALCAAVDHLEREFNEPLRLPIEVHVTVLRHLLSVLLLRLAHLNTASEGTPVLGETFLRFRNAVEQGFAGNHLVGHYAHTLGYSTRTLSRATQAAIGLGAKEFIDRRVILEAKRLLAHSEQPAARLAAQLGFSSATNFSKYFHQRTGMSPLSFRTAVRGGSFQQL